MGVYLVSQCGTRPDNSQVRLHWHSEDKGWNGYAKPIRKSCKGMRGPVCLFIKENAEHAIGKDKISCSSEWLIARSGLPRAGTDTRIVTSTKRIGARAALSPLNLTPIGSQDADNKLQQGEMKAYLYDCELNYLTYRMHLISSSQKIRLGFASRVKDCDGRPL